MKKKVSGFNQVYKDETTGVIVNRQGEDRRRYRLAKQQALSNLETRDDVDELKEELQELKSLKDDVDELKDLIKQLLNK